MKRIVPFCTAFWLAALLSVPVSAQTHTEKISKTAGFDQLSANSIVYVQNINGSVQVEGYNGDQVQIEVKKTVKADNQAALDLGVKEIKVGVEEVGDTVFVFIDAPFIHRKNRHHFQTNMKEVPYDFTLDFTVKVPRQVNLRVSSVNKGEVSVANTIGEVQASHVNGAVTLTNIAGNTKASTVNGNIEASYVKSPTADSEYRTINGEIRVRYPESLSADLAFRTLHGEFFTDFPVAQLLPAQMSKNTSNRKGVTVYKINKSQEVRIGGGGPKFSFELINGNIYVQKTK